MLCAWDPTWGEPALAVRAGMPGDQHVPNHYDLDQTYRITSRIIGLCEAGSEIAGQATMRVWASDHVDDAGCPLPPLPDRGQLALFLNRLPKKDDSGE